ncbi:MAG: hypothetical protein WCC99_01760 [Candidatus Sulfotelmatobacter sp.]
MNSSALGADGAADFQVFAAAAAGVGFAEADFAGGIEEAPGFAVFFEQGAGFTAGVGIEADAFPVSDGLDGDDVPEVFGDDIGNEEIDFGGGVDLTAGSGGFDAVAGLGVAGGGFDLHAEEAAVESDDRIVAVAVSPGKADAEAEVGGAGEEGGLGGFSATFAGRDGDGVDGDDFWGARLGARAMDDVRHNKKAQRVGCAG